MFSTSFQKVQAFNRLFYSASNSITFVNPSALETQQFILNALIDKLTTILQNDVLNAIALRNTATKILYGVYGISDIFGINYDAQFIYISNILIINYDTYSDLATHLKYINVTMRRLMYHIKNQSLDSITIEIYKMINHIGGIYVCLGLDICVDFAIIHASYMSRICASEEILVTIVEDYKAQFAAGVSPYENVAYFPTSKINTWFIKDITTGKILKTPDYIPITFQ